MKRVAKIANLLLLIYLAGSSIFFIIFDSLGSENNFSASFMIKWSLIGTVLFVAAFLAQYIDNSATIKRIKQLEQELDKTKLKLYQATETGRKPNATNDDPVAK
ncbi:hypothetical protein [Penaeicola halotolerans]|uniref:hypothetical protein n=1 Tax=Penaeicola halotolerans TaxID=2793196 RepID=UPI001CF8074F|nr:hypothetical protein [Penaeicola halotolerans]